jgi:hypothetical protein
MACKITGKNLFTGNSTADRKDFYPVNRHSPIFPAFEQQIPQAADWHPHTGSNFTDARQTTHSRTQNDQSFSAWYLYAQSEG